MTVYCNLKLTMMVFLLQLCPSKALKGVVNVCCGQLLSDMFLPWDLGVGSV